MNNRVTHLLLTALAALAALALAPLAAASPTAVVRDCAEDGSLDGSYSDADKRAALGQIPADIDEYSDCRSVIGGSLDGGKPTASASSNGTSSPGAAAATPQARRKAAAQRAEKVRQARIERARKVREKRLGARAVDPRDPGVFRAANTANGMPLPFTLALIALALIAVAGGLFTLWRRNPAFADAVRRVTSARFRR
jgi:hypothetical protein